MRKWKFISLVFLPLLCFGGLIGEKYFELSPFPMIMESSFNEAFLNKTGYNENYLVQRHSIFESERNVYCLISISAEMEIDGLGCVTDHRTFLASRKKENNTWKKMKLFHVPEAKFKTFIGFENEAVIQKLVKKFGKETSRDKIREALIILGGE